MSAVVSRWQDGRLVPRDDGDVDPVELVAADSWLTVDGRVRGLAMHRERFLSALPDEFAALDPEAFWDAAVADLPAESSWFPRVDARRVRHPHRDGAPELVWRRREAPETRRSIALATHIGRDPRRTPRTKGPDLEAMMRLRTDAQVRGADESVILESDGAVAEGSTTCLVWWRGDALCLPEPAIARVDSVTVRSALALAAATGVDVLHERARLEDLEGLEVWALNALHGIRIVTGWIDGPSTAEKPGRLTAWRSRLDALRRPVRVGSSA